ncbi:MAG: ribosome-recycling factor, partial [Candidatus Paceibacterota bacterium]
AKEKYEQARIQLRKHREEVHTDIDKKEKDGEIGEDDKFRLKAEMQKLVDEANKKLQGAMEKKEKEILS